MDYISIINLVFFGIGTLISIYLFHFAFFALSSLLHKKTYPSTVEKCRYGIIISAKDEENVIARVIKSIREADYPQDKLDIYVIAHNCSDHTGDIAKSLGAAVIIDNNKEENTLGQAYKYAFSHIDNISSYDGFIFFNADNTVAKDYFTKLNDAFVYYHKNDAISTFRHSLNMDEGVLPAVYSYYFTTSCVLAFSGRNNFNVSGRVTGCGFVIPSNQLLDGWKFTSITEDIEYSANSIANGRIIRFCYAATFYDEQPTKFKTMWHQRKRWAKGQQVISKEYFPVLFKALFNKNNKNKMSIYVSLTFHSCITLLVMSLFLLQLILLFLSPLFNISLYEAFLYWNHDVSWFTNMFLSMRTGFLFTFIKTLAMFFFSAYLCGLIVLLAAKDKYKGYKASNKMKAFILYPFFLALQFPLDLVVLFRKEVKWKKIPHGNK